MRCLKILFLILLASTGLATAASKLESSEIYFLQAYDYAEEAYIVRYIRLSNSKKQAMNMVNITAVIENVLKGSRQVNSQIDFYRLYDFDIDDQSHLEGRRFVVFFSKVKDDLVINPQDPMAAKIVTPELEKLLATLQ